MKKISDSNVKKYDTYALLAMVIVIVYTILYSFIKNPFKYCMTNIAIQNTRNLILYIIWGVCTTFLSTMYYLYIFKKVDFRNKIANRALIACNLCFLLTVFTPLFPRRSIRAIDFLHTYYAIFIAVFAAVVIIMLINHIETEHGKLPKYFYMLMISAIIVPLISYIFMGLNGFMEVYVVVIHSIVLILLNRYINNHYNIKTKNEIVIEDEGCVPDWRKRHL